MPFPVSLDVEVYLHDIVRIDEDMNSLSVKLDLWTSWIDLGLGLSNDEGPEYVNTFITCGPSNCSEGSPSKSKLNNWSL